MQGKSQLSLPPPSTPERRHSFSLSLPSSSSFPSMEASRHHASQSRKYGTASSSTSVTSKLRRTQSMAAHLLDDESSVSSLGSFPEADIVAQQFSTAKLARQQTIASGAATILASDRRAAHPYPSKPARDSMREQRDRASRPRRPAHHGYHRVHHFRKESSSPAQVGEYVPPQQKQCPHCLKAFRNSWAVPKHVSRIHDRAGELHCPRCLFKTHSPEWLQQHEKEAHRTCPYCQQLFVLLNKHVGTCPKRMH